MDHERFEVKVGYYTLKTASVKTGISYQNLQYAIHKGYLQSEKKGHERRILPEQLQAYLDFLGKGQSDGQCHTLAEAAAIAGCSTRKLADDISRGILKAITRGKRRSVTQKDLKAYLDADGDKDHMGERGWEPSPEEIRLACLQIQSEWTEEERMERAGRVRNADGDFGYEMPGCKTTTQHGAMDWSMVMAAGFED